MTSDALRDPRAYLQQRVEVFGHHLHSQPEPPSQCNDAVDEALDGVVLRCLEKDPDDRYPTAGDFANALLACSEADEWSRVDAQDWWDRERANVEARRTSEQEPSNLTLAPVNRQ